MTNNSTYMRPVIPAGNSFFINIALDKFIDGAYEDFDLTKVTDLKVYLICATHNTEIPLPYEIIPGINNVLKCFVDYRLLHTTSYGIAVEGYDEHDIHFRFLMLPKEGFLVVNNTSGMKVTDDVQVIDISGRCGWGIQTDGDLSNYYTKTEVDNIVAQIEVELGNTYTKEEINQLLTMYPTKAEINTRFNDYYTKTQTDNLLNQKANKSELATVATTGDYNDLTNKPNLNNYATKSDLNNYYDKGQTDGMLNNKVDTSTLVSEYYNKNTVNNLLDTKADTSDLNDFYNKQETNTLLNQKANVTDLNDKQDTLVSGTNIKTINNQSILGSGNIDIQGGSTQEQADWAQTNTTAVDYIKNKPDLSIYAETSDLATVATTGDYDDLDNKPDLSIYATQTDLETKQDTLISGVNIKTINEQSILGTGNITIQGGSGDNDEANEVTANALYDLNERLSEAEFNIELIPPQLADLQADVDSSLGEMNTTINEQFIEIDDEFKSAALVIENLNTNKQDTLVSGVNIKTINSESIIGTGNIVIQGGTQVNSDWNATTGVEMILNKPTISEPGFVPLVNGNNTGLVSSLSQVYDTNIGNGSLICGEGDNSLASMGILYPIKATGNYSQAFGFQTEARGDYSCAMGYNAQAWGRSSFALGQACTARNEASRVFGNTLNAYNKYETAIGIANYSTAGNNTFGEQRNIHFTIGNGETTSHRHNAIEIRQNGDIYYSDTEKIDGNTVHYYDAPMRKLQDVMVTSTTNGLKIEVVSALPASPDANTIYIIN